MTDSTPSPQPPRLEQPELTREQTQLLQVLRVRDGQFRTRVAEMYLGALHALTQSVNPERYCHAAQSMRELLEKLSRQHDGPSIQLPRTWASDYMASIGADLEIARKSECYDKTARTWRGEIDPPLQRLLIRVEEAVAKHRSNPKNREVQRQFLRGVISSSSQLPPEEEEPLLDQWKAFEKFFQDIAHHNRYPESSQFEERMSECTAFLLAALRLTLSTTLDLLDELIAEAESDA